MHLYSIALKSSSFASDISTILAVSKLVWVALRCEKISVRRLRHKLRFKEFWVSCLSNWRFFRILVIPETTDDRSVSKSAFHLLLHTAIRWYSDFNET
jgi:hypothetical protein